MKEPTFKDRKSLVDKLLEASAKNIIVPTIEQPIVLDNQRTREDPVQVQPTAANRVDEQGGLPVVGGVATAVLQCGIPKTTKRRRGDRGKDKVPGTRKPRTCKLCVKAGNTSMAAFCPGRTARGTCLYCNNNGTIITNGFI